MLRINVASVSNGGLRKLVDIEYDLAIVEYVCMNGFFIICDLIPENFSKYKLGPSFGIRRW